MAPSHNQIIATLALFTVLLLVELLYAHHNADASSIITSILPSQNTNGAKPTTKFDIIDATKNETLGFSKIFYISLPQ
jgi:hypothetical protein